MGPPTRPQAQNSRDDCVHCWRLVRCILILSKARLTFLSAFVAGLNNTIIQLVSLTEPELLTATGGGSNFFQGNGYYLMLTLLSIICPLTLCSFRSRILSPVFQLACY